MDTQALAQSFSTPQSTDNRKQYKYTYTNHGQSGCIPSSFQGRQTNVDHIPCKLNSNIQGPFIDFQGPYPVHPMSSHVWGDCFNNPKDRTFECKYNIS